MQEGKVMNCKKCAFWRQDMFNEHRGHCAMLKSGVQTDAGTLRRIQTYDTDTCPKFKGGITRAQYSAGITLGGGIRRVTPDMEIRKAEVDWK
jgi:hypothetical protein